MSVYSKVLGVVCLLLSISEGVSVLDSICDYIVPCSNYPAACDCSEVTNCNNCNNGNGCNQCSNNYFQASNEYNQQCLLCDLIDNCKFCHLGGCGQCENNCPLVQNSCGINVCDCGDDGSSPTTYKITPIPTAAPTVAPTTREDFFNQEIGNILKGGDVSNAFTNDAFIKLAFKSYTVEGGPEIFDSFFNGICDNGLVDVRKNFIVSTDMKAVTYEMYDACSSSVNGIFYISGRAHSEFDDNNKLIRHVAYFYDETDEDYCLQYANLRR